MMPTNRTPARDQKLDGVVPIYCLAQAVRDSRAAELEDSGGQRFKMPVGANIALEPLYGARSRRSAGQRQLQQSLAEIDAYI